MGKRRAPRLGLACCLDSDVFLLALAQALCYPLTLRMLHKRVTQRVREANRIVLKVAICQTAARSLPETGK